MSECVCLHHYICTKLCRKYMFRKYENTRALPFPHVCMCLCIRVTGFARVCVCECVRVVIP